MDLKPIFHKESEEMRQQLSNFICEHNMLTDIIKIFEENKTAKQFFEEAREEVLESGNSSLSSMYVIALKNLITKAEAYIEEENETTDLDKLHNKIWKLERENRILKTKVETIEEILKGE